MSFCSHSVSLSYPLHQSKLFPQLTAERLTCITPARTYTRAHLHTHINTLRFKTESRSETLTFQQSPSDFGRKVWKKKSDRRPAIAVPPWGHAISRPQWLGLMDSMTSKRVDEG